jgi:hypothetical protein
MSYSLHEVKELIRNENIRETLVDYCRYLSSQYNETNEGKYFIKHADLYRVLFECLSDEKLTELFNSFTRSLDIYPILKIRENSILLQSI